MELRAATERDTTVLIADDHDLVLEGLRTILEVEPGVRICGVARNGMEAVAHAARLRPDVAVIDLAMPGLNGVETTRQIHHHASPSTQVVVLTGSDCDELLCDACAAGASGYVLKSDGSGALVDGIRAVATMGRYFSPGVRLPPGVLEWAAAPAGVAHPRRPGGRAPHASSMLTPREREIAHLLARGETNQGIAHLLGISIKTVETHRGHLMLKLGCKSIAALVRYAVRTLMIAP